MNDVTVAEPSDARIGAAPDGSRLRLVALGTAVGAVGAAVYVATHNPYTQQVGPACPLLALTGLDCPLCGGTRSAYSLMQGDVLGALKMNAFAVTVILPLALVFIVDLWRGRRALARRLWTDTRIAWTVLAIGLTFTVARNIPGLEQFLGTQ